MSEGQRAVLSISAYLSKIITITFIVSGHTKVGINFDKSIPV